MAAEFFVPVKDDFDSEQSWVGEADESSQVKFRDFGTAHQPSTVAEAICRAMNMPYYGFILYSTAHPRLANFLRKYQTFIDETSGEKILFIAIAKPSDQPLAIEEVMAAQTDEIKRRIRSYVRSSTESYNPDKSIRIAKRIGLRKSHLPCIALYRRRRPYSYSPLAVLKMKDDWFPKLGSEEETIGDTSKWLTALCEALDEVATMKGLTNKDAGRLFQNAMNKTSFKQNVWRPYLLPLLSIPIKTLLKIPEIIEKVGNKQIEKVVIGAEKS